MRNYAQVSTSLWAPDSDFRKLPARAQRLYKVLMTQPNITAAGVLPLTVKRWANLAPDTPVDEIEETLVILEDARYVVIDRDAEELLVRSFVRWDKGYGNPKRRPVIVRAAGAVASMPIRLAISQEFQRLGLPTDGLPDSDPHSPSPSDGVVVTVVEQQTSTLNPQPPPPSHADALDLEDADPVGKLIAAVLEVRPEWSASSVERVLRDPEIRARPFPVVAAALLIVARDPESSVPGRVRADGPWWSDAAGARASPQLLDPPCGECGPNRQIEVDGAVARCPRCHPLRSEAS